MFIGCSLLHVSQHAPTDETQMAKSLNRSRLEPGQAGSKALVPCDRVSCLLVYGPVANFSLGSPNNNPQSKDLSANDVSGKCSHDAMAEARGR